MRRFDKVLDPVVVRDRENDVGLEIFDEAVERLLADLVFDLEETRIGLVASNRDDFPRNLYGSRRSLFDMEPSVLNDLKFSALENRLEDAPNDPGQPCWQQGRVGTDQDDWPIVVKPSRLSDVVAHKLSWGSHFTERNRTPQVESVLFREAVGGSIPALMANRLPTWDSPDLRWAQGFLDRACSVSAEKKAIEVTTGWEDGLRTIYAILGRIGIKSKLRLRKAGGWLLRISGEENLKIWARVGFKDPKKQNTLCEILRALDS